MRIATDRASGLATNLADTMRRPIFDEEHAAFRKSARRFFAEHVTPHREKFEKQGYVDREVWKKAGELGFLCMTAPAEYGGAEGCLPAAGDVRHVSSPFHFCSPVRVLLLHHAC